MIDLEKFLDEFVKAEYPNACISSYDLKDTVEKKNWRLYEVVLQENALSAYINRRPAQQVVVDHFNDGPEEDDETKQIENIIQTIHDYILLHAAKSGETELAKLALEKGANPNVAGIYYGERTFPLIEATMKNNIELVRILIDSGADVNIQKRNGESPLADASCYDYYEIAKILLERGANPNIMAKGGLSPLTQVENVEMVRLLLDHGANPNIPDNDGDLPIIYRIDNRDRDSVVALIKAGTDLDHKNRWGKSARMGCRLLVGDINEIMNS